jgi:hypothetical protein
MVASRMRRPFVLTALLFACNGSQPEPPAADAEQPATLAAAEPPVPAVITESRAATAERSGLPADIFDGDPMYERLEETARTHAGEVVERLGLWDIAFPSNPEEAVALMGLTVVMITATTQIAEELPPKRIYTNCGSEDFELRVLVSRVIPFDASWSGIIGRTRYDGFYVLPLQHVRPGCKLLIDWAINRTGQVISEFDDEVPPDVPVLPPIGAPDEDLVWAVLEREYPFLFAKK